MEYTAMDKWVDEIKAIMASARQKIVAEYALGGLSNQVFASNYVYYVPDKKLLVSEVKYLLEQEKETNGDD